MLEGKIKPENQCPNVLGFYYYTDAFKELMTCKSEGSSIPFTSIVEYFKIYGEGEDFDDFLYIIRQMDMALIEFEQKKLKKDQGSKNGRSVKNHSNKV